VSCVHRAAKHKGVISADAVDILGIEGGDGESEAFEFRRDGLTDLGGRAVLGRGAHEYVHQVLLSFGR
jgi:hypothetical protein